MATVKFISLPASHYQNRHRSYLVQIKSKHCLGTEIIKIEYGTNGEEWDRLKHYVETRFSFMLDEGEETDYYSCGIELTPQFHIHFNGEDATPVEPMEETTEDKLKKVIDQARADIETEEFYKWRNNRQTSGLT